MQDRIKFNIHFIGGLLLTIYFNLHFLEMYTTAKWALLYGFTFLDLTIFLITTKTKIAFPKLNKTNYFFLALILIYVINIYFNTGNFEKNILDWLCFFILIFISIQYWEDDPKRSFQYLSLYTSMATICVIIVGYAQLFKLQLFSNLPRTRYPSSLFGYQNITAEFLGASLLIHFHLALTSKKNYKVKYFEIMTILSISFLFFLSCRAVILALVFSLSSYVYLSKKFNYKKAIQILISATVGIIVINNFIPKKKARVEGSYFTSEKTLYAQIRLARWANSFNMLRDNPVLGVGPDNYTFNYLPYSSSFFKDTQANRPSTLIRSVHNSILEIIIEYGSIIFLLLTIIGYQLGKDYFKKQRKSHLFELNISIILMVFITSLFAFPMDNVFIFYLIAVIMGNIIPSKQILISKPYKWKPFLFLVAIYIMYQGAGYFTSYIYGHMSKPSYKQISLACDAFPSNWRACIRKANLEIHLKKTKKAKQTLEKILKTSPHNYIALQTLGNIYQANNQKELACKQFNQFKKLFHDIKIYDSYCN